MAISGLHIGIAFGMRLSATGSWRVCCLLSCYGFRHYLV
ncbi:hypothetical protein OH492_19745 [Vibrio chagasii]|nr:hypothetical protein [Vibrio chagasii]